MHYSLQQKGFSLLEVLLAVGIFALLASFVGGIFITGSRDTVAVGTRSKAILFAEAGIEAVRNIRDNDFSSLTVGTHGLATSSNTWILSGSSDEYDGLTRTVTISDIDTNTKNVYVEVTWDAFAGRNNSVALEARLTNWHRAISAGEVFRITEYFINSGFVDNSYTLSLAQNLVPDYFVIIQGSDGDGIGSGTYGPDANYVALVGDPFGTGDLATTSASTTLALRRGGNGGSNSWTGVVSVVECIADCDVAGFRLRSVDRISHSDADTIDTVIANASWTNLLQVVLFGGFNAAGCTTTEASEANTKVCHVRLFPSGINTISWTRDAGGATLSTASSTVMAVEWGSEWTVQRTNVVGDNGGNGANATGEYNTGIITNVVRDNTWVWGTGHTNDEGIGDSAEAVLVTLGNGVDQDANEGLVAAGIEYNNNDIDFDIYAMTHDDLAVDYRFKSDGDSNAKTFDATIDSASNGTRLALAYNGSHSTGTSYPRPMWSARYVTNDAIRMERRRQGQNWPAWIQGIDFSGIDDSGGADTTPPNAVSDLAITDVSSTSISLSWTAPGDDGIVGTSTTYDMRYSTVVITEVNWSSATQVSGEPTPAVSGSSESMTIAGLSGSTEYYVALKSSDEVPNTSALSNVVSTTTLPSATEADVLLVNTLSAIINPLDTSQVTGITLTNTSLSDTVTVDQITVSWTGGQNGAKLKEINIGNSSVWTGNASSGSTHDITDVVINPLLTTPITFLDWSKNMTGMTLSLTFIMSDGSSQTVSGITP